MNQEQYDSLTPMERNCLRLAHHERKAEQIAHELGIKASTVNTHIFSARRKLGGLSRLTAADQLRTFEAADAPDALAVLATNPTVVGGDLVEPGRRAEGTQARGSPQELSRQAEWMADGREARADGRQPTEVREPRSAFVFDMHAADFDGRDERRRDPLRRVALILAIAMLAALVLIAAPAIYDSAATRIANSLEPPHPRLPRP